MEKANLSVVTEFIFHGLCNSKELQTILLVPFSILYLMTIVGNFLVVFLIMTDPHLHSPMYFLLTNLYFVDLCISSATTPKLTTDFLKDNKTISFGVCVSQILCVHLFVGDEMVLLVTMAYDHYVAICKPLHYSIITDRKKCLWLVSLSWIIGFVHAMSQLAMILYLAFCGHRILDSFFCDIPLVIKLACMDTHTVQIWINTDSGLVAISCFILLLISYTSILLTVHLKSEDGASKALSTWTPHITIVLLLYGPCIFIYLWPLSITWVDKFLAVFYTIITPLLNPAIYTLRNKKIKNAMRLINQQRVQEIYFKSLL